MIKSEAIVSVPDMVFKTRVRDESIGGDNPYRWQDVSTDELFGGKKILVFSLPGAFTPTCSTFQLPDFADGSDAYANNFDTVLSFENVREGGKKVFFKAFIIL